jgi:hypothetical protein
MPLTSPEWELEVSRGPDSLWVKVHQRSNGFAGESPPLVDELWALLERHFLYRLVLDLGEIESLGRELLGQLLRLQRRIRGHGGLMRICGLSGLHREMLHRHGVDTWMADYGDLEEAVMGSWPRKPR